MDRQSKLNSHLKVVFTEILPAIHNAGFRYWVYGGVAIAGIKGEFIRKNEDVDIYVLDGDYAIVTKLLETLCQSKDDWNIRKFPPNERGRPKLEIRISGREVFSMIPTYKIGEDVEFRAKSVVTLVQEQALRQELRSVGGYNFFPPPKNVIKRILRSLIIERPKLLHVGRRRDDAIVIFTEEELNELKGVKKLRK